MSASDIITGQFVRISQTPASVGDRIMARIIDYTAIALYAVSVTFLLLELPALSGTAFYILWLPVVFVPAAFYSFLCETFNQGQTLGKRIMKTRVVKTDGSTPGVGDFMLRWLLQLVDIHTSCIGLIPIIFTDRNQRFGDMAAGTMVIKLSEYKKIHISLDEFSYARRDYKPVYSEAMQLSLGQADVIRKTLDSKAKGNDGQVARLSAKVQHLLGIKPKESTDAEFLLTLLHDYQYYSIELV